MNSKMLKMAINMIGPETIETGLQSIILAAISHKQNIEFEPGENDAIIILFESEGETFATLATIDATTNPPSIKRQQYDKMHLRVLR